MEGRPPDELELGLRAQQGDARAFEQLVGKEREILFRVAYLITRDAAEAEDAAQDGLVKAWRAFGRFRNSEPLRPWLLRIVANEARNRRRSAGRRARLFLRAAEAARVSGDAAPSPEELAVTTEGRRQLLSELDGLPEQARLVLACRFLLGLSEAETAGVLGLPRGTVKSRTARALRKLREAHV